MEASSPGSTGLRRRAVGTPQANEADEGSFKKLVSGADDAVDDLAFAEVEAQESPVFAGVDTPMGRFKVEVLQQKIDTIRYVIASELGPELGLAAGFNSQDGD